MNRLNGRCCGVLSTAGVALCLLGAAAAWAGIPCSSSLPRVGAAAEQALGPLPLGEPIEVDPAPTQRFWLTLPPESLALDLLLVALEGDLAFSLSHEDAASGMELEWQASDQQEIGRLTLTGTEDSPLAPGRHLVQVRAQRGDQGRGVLLAQQLTYSAPAATRLFGGQLRLGQPAAARLTTDTSTWELIIEQDACVRVDLQSDAFDPVLVLLNNAGDVEQLDDDGGEGYDARIQFRASAGSYPLRVDGVGEAGGAYRLSAKQFACAAVTGPDWVSGTLVPGERHYIVLPPGPVGDAFQLDLQSDAFDPALEVQASGGAVLVEVADSPYGGDDAVLVTVREDNSAPMAVIRAVDDEGGDYRLRYTELARATLDARAEPPPDGVQGELSTEFPYALWTVTASTPYRLRIDGDQMAVVAAASTPEGEFEVLAEVANAERSPSRFGKLIQPTPEPRPVIVALMQTGQTQAHYRLQIQPVEPPLRAIPVAVRGDWAEDAVAGLHLAGFAQAEVATSSPGDAGLDAAGAIRAHNVPEAVLDEIEALLRSRWPLSSIPRFSAPDAGGPPSIIVQLPPHASDRAARLPDGCDGSADLGELRLGSRVLLNAPRALDAEDHLVEDGREYLWHRATVTEINGWDPRGCAVVGVDLDAGDHDWRVRDLALLDGIAAPAPEEQTTHLSLRSDTELLEQPVALAPRSSQLLRLPVPEGTVRVDIALESAGADLDLLARPHLPFNAVAPWYSVRLTPDEQLVLDDHSEPPMPEDAFDLYLRVFNDTDQLGEGSLRVRVFDASEPLPRTTEQLLELPVQDLAGVWHSLAEWRGEFILVNLWATWCPPCLDEIPELVELQSRYAERGLQVVGLSDEPIAALAEFAGAHGPLNYPLLSGQYLPLLERLDGYPNGVPFTLLLDRDGVLVHTHAGQLNAEALEPVLRRHLGTVL